VALRIAWSFRSATLAPGPPQSGMGGESDQRTPDQRLEAPRSGRNGVEQPARSDGLPWAATGSDGRAGHPL